LPTTNWASRISAMAQVAEQIGTSRQTLYSWIKAGHVAAPKPTAIGKQSYRLWTPADIKQARKFVGTSKLGPKTLK
jgi:predicted DNA-binding transcriptional regulator AlpA